LQIGPRPLRKPLLPTGPVLHSGRRRTSRREGHMPEEGAVSVLAIDPDPVVLHFIRRIAQGLGYGFAGARRAEAALERMEKAPPDAVVMRATLPDMTGREFISILRAQPSAPPCC